MSLIEQHGLLVVAIMVAVAEMGLPTGVSPKIALLLAGSITIGSPTALILALLLVTGANLIGATLLHLLARRGGGWVVTRILGSRGVRPEGVMERWRVRCGGHDAAAIFLGRITPVVRIYVTLASGLLRVRWRDFFLGAGLAGVVWSGLPLVLGFVFRDNVAELTRSPLFMQMIVLILPMIGVVAAAGWWIFQVGTLAAAMRRVRVVTSGGTAIAVALWAVKAIRASSWARGHHLSAPDLPVLLCWLGILGLLVTATIARTVADLSGGGTRCLAFTRPKFATSETFGTCVWAGGLGIVAAIVAGIELMYPAL